MTKVVSVEFCTSERKRSSLTRIEVSASSFCSIVAPAMRMTKMSTNAPMSPRASLLPTDRNDGAQRCQMATWPTDDAEEAPQRGTPPRAGPVV